MEEEEAASALIGKMYIADRDDGAEHQYRFKMHFTGPMSGTVILDTFCESGEAITKQGEIPGKLAEQIAKKMGEIVNLACELTGQECTFSAVADETEAAAFAKKHRSKVKKDDKMKSFIKKMPREIKEQIRDLLTNGPDEDGPVVLGVTEDGKVEKVDLDDMKESFDQYLGAEGASSVVPDDPELRKQIDDLFADDPEDDN
jgi:hypothetical protein